tara:strand:- start:742 stop:1032 length:291 start_codon:yes stop_codon:yes gene_type:complete
MKFIRSKIDYFKNEIITYYEKDDGKIVKKKNKFNKLLPYNNLKHNEEDTNILPYNYYDLKTEKFKTTENIYTGLYETESTLYNDVYNKEFNYEMNF